MTGEKNLSIHKQDPNFLREVWQQMRLVFYLLRDPEVPFYLKFLPFLAVLYVLWPIDFITDLLPFFGQLDDVTALLVGAKVFIELAPQPVMIKHLNLIRARDGYGPIGEEYAPSALDEDDVTNAIIIDGEVIQEKDQE